MKNILKLVMIQFLLFALFTFSYGQGRQRPNIEQRVENEKKSVLEKVTDLSEDQQLIFDQIYIEYGEALKETFENNAGNFQGMREKMVVIRNEKDEALKEVLNESQYASYKEVMEAQDENRRRRRGNRGGRPNGN